MKMLKREAALKAALAIAAILLTGASSPRNDAGEWLTIGRTHDEQHYSPLSMINDKNVGRLGLAWYRDLNTDRGIEAAPLYRDGVLYMTSAWNRTEAIDARTGRRIWAYDPQVPPQYARWACCDVVTRGLALWKDKVIIATLDGRLIALDAKKGTPAWSVRTFEEGKRYAITGAPRAFDGKVVIGNAGGDFGARGYVTAYDAETGAKLWRFYTVPGDPAKPDSEISDAPLKQLAQPTWKGEWWKQGGGGTPWDAIVYDEKLRRVYIGVGNGGPSAQAFRSPGGGDNLFLASIVAVDADTGRYIWHYQQNPGEEWDYTATQPIVLADLLIGGKRRPVLMQAPKNGFFYVIDRETGKLISADPFSAVNWAKGIDPQTGRPIENAEIARYDNEPRLIAPGPGGAHNWQPMAFHPGTGLVYMPVQEHWAVYPLGPGRPESTPGQEVTQARMKKAAELWAEAERREKAWLSAWDPVGRREIWRVPQVRPGAGGVLATGGNLIFQGTPEKKLVAMRADNGKQLWSLDVQTVPMAAPITYMLDGEQYIVASAGWGGGMALVEMGQGKPRLQVSTARLLAFKLGGTAKLPTFVPPTETRVEPPLARAPEAVVSQGAKLYATTCAACHGENVRGGIKDLRWMTRETHAKFRDIVLGGIYTEKGMVSFRNELSDADADAIHAYITARANEDFFAKDAQ